MGITMNSTESLRQLDAAPEVALTAAETARSEALLASVLADREPARGPRPARSHATRNWILVGAGALAVAAVAVATLQVPHASSPSIPAANGPLPAIALASWTGTPTVLPASAAAVQAPEKWCLDSMSSGPGASSVASITNVDQRGSVTSMIVTRAGYAMLCIAGPNSTGFWELDGDPGDPVPALVATQLTIESAGGHGAGVDGFNYVEGRAGASVASISLTESGRTFTAPVSNGRWTAWWPDAAATGELTGSLTVTATDGTTSTVSVASLQK
jgi:hypothetical protein